MCIRDRIQTGNESGFGDFPYASCELGPGNQVTQHRRPIIHENDGYGVGFTRYASGMNWIGYYMYHGGRNPNDRWMQESRITGYPKNDPIIDYDFQAPISRWGECRPHGDRLRDVYKRQYLPRDDADRSALRLSRVSLPGRRCVSAGALSLIHI